MSKKCYAAIDIGSNAARLLIKREEENENLVSRKLAKVLLLRVPLRLGFDVFALGKLSDERIIKMRRLMKAYRQLMKIYEVTDYRACATSAMRDAKNGKAVINKILRETGIHIEIIDGQEEARMIYNNHVECLEDRTGNFIYVDVGGGSTEINLMVNGELVQSLSYNIGTVRILSGAVKRGASCKTTCGGLPPVFKASTLLGRAVTSTNSTAWLQTKTRRRSVCPLPLCKCSMTNSSPLPPNSV